MERKKTNKGYIRLRRNNRAVFEHILVWESVHGKIPEGMQIHHKDHNKANNNIGNLQLLSTIDHKRIHCGCKLIDSEWHKPCKDCGEFKKCDKENWYLSRGWINGKVCKKCFIKKSIEVRAQLIAKGWKRKNYSKKNNNG